MSASQFVLENIIGVFGGTGVVVTSLSVYLGKLLADRSLMREKASLDKELQHVKDSHAKEIRLIEKELQLELTKKDQFHQISKSTFENLFNQKIKIYAELLNILKDHDKFINESGSFEFIEPTDTIFNHYSSLKKVIENNRLYISNELSDKFDEWYKEASPFLQKMDQVEYELHSSRGANESDMDIAQSIWDEQQQISSNLVFETNEKMSLLIKQINLDVAKIRGVINTIQAT